MQRKRVFRSSQILNECNVSCKIVKKGRKEKFCLYDKKSMFKRLVYTPPDLSRRFTCKVNLSNTKNPAWFYILASLLDRGMEGVNWLPPRTIMCFMKLYSGLSNYPWSQAQTELLERLWIKLIKLRWWATGLFCLGIDQFG